MAKFKKKKSKTSLFHIFSKDIFIEILSHLSLHDLISLISLNQELYEFLIAPENDKIIYKLFLKNLIFDLTNYKLKESQLDNYSSYRSLLKEFYYQPLIEKKEYDATCYKDYQHCYGPLDITIIEPCEVLKIILDENIYTELSDLQKNNLHKFILLFYYYNINICKGSGLGIYEKNNKLKYIFIGAFLEMLLKQKEIKEIKTYKKKKEDQNKNENKNEIIVKKWDKNEPFPLKQFGEPYFKEEGEKESILVTRRPPYGIRNQQLYDVSITAMMKDLKLENTNDFEVGDFGENITEENCWDNYWRAGLEWWGCYCYTICNFKTKKFIVLTASTTD
ncbi:hypothetical protein ABK040_002317 [Willaertia magna]